MIFTTQQRLVFVGDSITDAERLWSHPPLGSGFVSFISHLLHASHPELRLTLLNRGHHGNTTRDLLRRWQRDVIQECADWVFISVGINDVWRSHGMGNAEDGVPIQEYESNIEQLFDLTQATGGQVVALEPYVMQLNLQDPVRSQMDEYRAKLHQICTARNITFVRLQAAFDRVLEVGDHSEWSLHQDRIHPNSAGHMLIALEVLRTMQWSVAAETQGDG